MSRQTTFLENPLKERETSNLDLDTVAGCGQGVGHLGHGDSGGGKNKTQLFQGQRGNAKVLQRGGRICGSGEEERSESHWISWQRGRQNLCVSRSVGKM